MASSLPLRERGLKLHAHGVSTGVEYVAPFTGAWIEMVMTDTYTHHLVVAPFTGAWIEIWGYDPHSMDMMVAPFTGAWIEILG